MAQNDNEANYETFRDCFSSALLERISRPHTDVPKKRAGRKNTTKSRYVTQDQLAADDNDLSEFTEFLASEIFPSLPQSLQGLSYSGTQANSSLLEEYGSLTQSEVEESYVPLLPASVAESITTYALLPTSTSIGALLEAAVTSYVSAVTAPPPVWSGTRTDACEICERDWIPLTYHHLIPRSTHARVLKRGWHEEWELNRVAWLCRACHSYVHRIASNEELARDWSTVERLLEREDVQTWAKWVGRVRWKAR